MRDIGVTGVQTCALPISWRLAFDFSGRSPRREWALFLASYYGVVFFLMAIATSFGQGARDVFGIAAGLWILACIVPALALGVRRLHDHNKSGDRKSVV